MNKVATRAAVPVPSRAPSAAPRSVAATLRRLRQMPLSEIAGRSRQEAAKLFDRVTAAARPIDPLAILREHAPAYARSEAALDVLRSAGPGRFFAGVEDVQVAAHSFPDHRAALLRGAAATLEKRFDLLGYRTLWFGDPIDWHLDPVSGRRAPRAHWTEINPLDPRQVGDSKVVWELNRHQWVASLAAAYAASGDERHAEGVLAAIESWIAANPYGIGVNWSSSLEVAYRMMSWSWALMLIRDSAQLSTPRLQQILANVWLHARYVARYLSFYFSPNTHLTGEALGLFCAGSLFSEFREAKHWQCLGARVLVAEARSQICPDGVHFERSTCYHRYTLETYQQFLLLAARNRMPVPGEIRERVQRMSDFVLSMQKPDGNLPEIGDADGGRLLTLVERGQYDPRGVLAVSAAMFGRGDFADAAGSDTPELAWLMGAAGLRALEAAAPSSGGVASRVFASGGYAVMKSGGRRDAHHLIVDVGPLGCSFSAGHGHADLLSMQCAAFGEPVLVDPGTYCYSAQPEWRRFFRSTAAHSTLTLDGRDQAEPTGPFSWSAKPQAHLREWRSTADCDFVDASHNAYPGITHRRRVLFVKPDYWVVVDDVYEKGGGSPGSCFAHRLDLGFQFAPMDVAVVRDRWARARTPGGNTFWIRSFAPGLLKAHVKTGELAPIAGWVSPDYGQRTPAPFLVYTAKARLPWRSITLLIPQRGDRSNVPDVSALFDDHNLPIGLELDDRSESIFVEDDEIYRSLDR